MQKSRTLHNAHSKLAFARVSQRTSENDNGRSIGGSGAQERALWSGVSLNGDLGHYRAPKTRVSAPAGRWAAFPVVAGLYSALRSSSNWPFAL